MELELAIQGQDVSEDNVFSLEDWLQGGSIEGISVERKSSPIGEDDMGEPISTILGVILASAAVVELVKSIHVWLQTRQQKLEVKIKLSENKEISIKSEGPVLPDIEELVDKVTDALKQINEAQ